MRANGSGRKRCAVISRPVRAALSTRALASVLRSVRYASHPLPHVQPAWPAARAAARRVARARGGGGAHDERPPAHVAGRALFAAGAGDSLARRRGAVRAQRPQRGGPARAALQRETKRCVPRSPRAALQRRASRAHVFARAARGGCCSSRAAVPPGGGCVRYCAGCGHKGGTLSHAATRRSHHPHQRAAVSTARLHAARGLAGGL